jgi:hypothetical protein
MLPSSEVSNRFAALEYLEAEVEIDSAWETIRENIKISAKGTLAYFELKKHMTLFEEGSSKLLYQGNKLNCSGYTIQVKKNGDNLNN